MHSGKHASSSEWREYISQADGVAVAACNHADATLAVSDTPGMAAVRSSWYLSSIKLAALGTFTRNCNSSRGPLCCAKSRSYISAWRRPASAVTHCTSPGADGTVVASRVAARKVAVAHYCHGLKASVRVEWKTQKHLDRHNLRWPNVADKQVRAESYRMRGGR